MTASREYYVIEFKDPPVMDLDRYICVPKSWTGRPFEDTSQPKSVVVKYPLEKQGTTRSRVKRYDDYDDEWKIYIASVKYHSESYKDALAYIKLLHKSNEGYLQSYPEQSNRAASTDNNTPRNRNQSIARTTSTEPRESNPSDVQGSSAERTANKNRETKKKYIRKSQNKENTSNENRTEQQSGNENISTLFKTVTEELKNISRELVGLFNNFGPMIEKLQTDVSQNSIMLEKIHTLIDKPDRPEIDRTIPPISSDKTQNNAEGEINRTISNELRDNAEKEIDRTIPTVSREKTQNNADEEIDRSIPIVSRDKAQNNAEGEIDRTIPTVPRGKTHNNKEEEVVIGIKTKTTAGNTVTRIDDSIAPSSKNTTPTIAMEVEVETRSKLKENNPDAIDAPNTHDGTNISEDKDTTVDEVNAGIPQSTSAITTEETAPVRIGMKRKSADADASIPMKKRDGPRNHTLQSSQNNSEITFNSQTKTAPMIVESIPGRYPEYMGVTPNYLTFIEDAIKVALLYKKT